MQDTPLQNEIQLYSNVHVIPLLHVLAAIASTEHVCVWLLPHACVHVRSGVKELSGHLLSSGNFFLKSCNVQA